LYRPVALAADTRDWSLWSSWSQAALLSEANHQQLPRTRLRGTVWVVPVFHAAVLSGANTWPRTTPAARMMWCCSSALLSYGPARPHAAPSRKYPTKTTRAARPAVRSQGRSAVASLPLPADVCDLANTRAH
jgi:hypothetical protein